MAPRLRSDVLANLGLGLALLPGALGVGMLLQPQRAVEQFGLAPATAAEGATFRGFLTMHAVRDVVTSLLLAGLRYRDDRRLLGLGLLTCCLMAGVDGLVSRQLTGGGEWQHWGILPFLVAVGGSLAWQG